MNGSILLIISLLNFLPFIFGDSQTETPKRCNIAYKCSTDPKPVWTSADNKTCEVFRNNCYMLSENCQRLNSNKPELIDIGQEKCQELCKSAPPCPTDQDSVCGYYNDERKTFASECEMKKYVCEAGKTFDLFSVGQCKSLDSKE